MKYLYKVEVLVESYYVIANNPTNAYNTVRKFLDKNNLFFRVDRELKSIELVAENSLYPDCKQRLLFEGKENE